MTEVLITKCRSTPLLIQGGSSSPNALPAWARTRISSPEWDPGPACSEQGPLNQVAQDLGTRSLQDKAQGQGCGAPNPAFQHKEAFADGWSTVCPGRTRALPAPARLHSRGPRLSLKLGHREGKRNKHKPESQQKEVNNHCYLITFFQNHFQCHHFKAQHTSKLSKDMKALGNKFHGEPKNVLKAIFLKTVDSKMYFRIGHLFIGSCSDYLNFQGSERRKKTKRVQQRKHALRLLYYKKQKSKWQNPLSRTEFSQNPTVQGLNLWERNPKVLQYCISQQPFTSLPCATVLNKTPEFILSQKD